jgi:hypothetical protein
MRDYSKLVKALRCKRDDCEGCNLAFFDKDEGWMCQYAAKDDDAADAIEALQAQMPKRGVWVFKKDGDSGHHECSVCKGRELYTEYGHGVLTGFCPHCGADLCGGRYDEKMDVRE